MEIEAAERTLENKGATELVESLHRSGVPLGIITRNTRESVERSLARLPGIDPAWFDVVVTRDLPLSPKPFPDGVHYAAEKLGVDVAELLVVGDYAFDIEAGRRAGALTMYLYNDPRGTFHGEGADFVVRSLEEALAVIRQGIPLPPGKLPADLLERSLAGLSGTAIADPSVLVGAAIGEDAAAVDVGDAEVLVLASDPVTLAADSLSLYAVIVNANDVATSGATPRWLVTTLLFPPGSTASEIMALTAEIQEVCGRLGVSLCGGHTEITDAVSRPLVVGTMAGTARRTELLDKRRMREGDRVLLTKAVAVEGTGLIAREFGERLLAAGMTQAEVEEVRRLPGAHRDPRGGPDRPVVRRGERDARRDRGRSGDGGEGAGRSRRPPAAPPPRPYPRLSADGPHLRAPGPRPSWAHRVGQSADRLRPRGRAGSHRSTC